MIWTYRIFRDQNGRYSIREVYYERDGQLLNYGKNPVAPVSASLEDLLQMVQWFREAFDSPVLSLEAAEAELAAKASVPSPKKSLADRSHAIPFKQVLAQLAAEPEGEDEQESEIETA